MGGKKKKISAPQCHSGNPGSCHMVVPHPLRLQVLCWTWGLRSRASNALMADTREELMWGREDCMPSFGQPRKWGGALFATFHWPELSSLPAPPPRPPSFQRAENCDLVVCPAKGEAWALMRTSFLCTTLWAPTFLLTRKINNCCLPALYEDLVRQ